MGRVCGLTIQAADTRRAWLREDGCGYSQSLLQSHCEEI